MNFPEGSEGLVDGLESFLSRSAAIVGVGVMAFDERAVLRLDRGEIDWRGKFKRGKRLSLGFVHRRRGTWRLMGWIAEKFTEHLLAHLLLPLSSAAHRP